MHIYDVEIYPAFFSIETRFVKTYRVSLSIEFVLLEYYDKLYFVSRLWGKLEGL